MGSGKRRYKFAAAVLTLGLTLLSAGHTRAATTLDPAEIEWRQLAHGFEVAEPGIKTGERSIGRLLLARIDPAKFRFTLHNTPSRHSMKDWLGKLGAVMVINGGFFLADGSPATPMVSKGVLSGPKTYAASHGAFVVSPDFTGIRDLRQSDWRDAFKGAADAAVSFPLLLAADGRDAVQPSDKSADRSFVGQDGEGRIILGTSEAFFTLPDFAAFLKTKALGLTAALNLDGGPFGCQQIAYQGFSRSFCGFNAEPGSDPANRPPLGPGDQGKKLPIVMAVTPK